MENVISTIVEIMIDKKLIDKVYGRRNYVIITYDNTYWKLGFGEAARRGLLSWRLMDMKKHNIHFFEYTYKKDCDACEKALIEIGYKN